ncbi:MAG: hypothetical protein ACRDRY_22680 [Pseudonocardiaceae bacterium]
MVTGTLRTNSFETREGEKRTSLELTVDDIGASLKFAMVKVNRAEAGTGDAGKSADDDEPPF